MELTMEQKKKALAMFDTPEEFYPEALKMLTSQELELILLMGKDVIPEDELERRIGEAGIAKFPRTLIRTAYTRCVTKKVRLEDNTLCYQIMNFYARYPYFAQFEYEEYARFPRARKDRLNQWDYSIYLAECRDMVQAKLDGQNIYLHDGDFLTLEQAIESVQDYEFLCVVPCNCKCMMDLTQRPRDTCLHTWNGENSAWDRGHGRQVTVEQAVELIKMWRSRGLMQNGNPFMEGGFCNCDCPSCYPIQMSKELGAQGIHPRAYWTIHWDASKCINCAKCTKVCNFEAFTVGADKKVVFEPQKCWGCTVCTDNCPTGAITKTPVKDAPPMSEQTNYEAEGGEAIH